MNGKTMRVLYDPDEGDRCDYCGKPFKPGSRFFEVWTPTSAAFARETFHPTCRNMLDVDTREVRMGNAPEEANDEAA